MIFEDAHWIDPSSLELFESNRRQSSRRLRVLLVVTFRPEFDPSWIRRQHVSALTLNRLAQRETNAMIDSWSETSSFLQGFGRTLSSVPTVSPCSWRR